MKKMKLRAKDGRHTVEKNRRPGYEQCQRKHVLRVSASVFNGKKIAKRRPKQVMFKRGLFKHTWYESQVEKQWKHRKKRESHKHVHKRFIIYDIEEKLLFIEKDNLVEIGTEDIENQEIVVEEKFYDS